MSALEKLLDVSSESISSTNDLLDLPREIANILQKRNGFFAFEFALEVFPATTSEKSYSIYEWNEDPLWASSFGKLSPAGLCFAQDVFGNQFVATDEIWLMDAETAEMEMFAANVEGWAERLLDDYAFVTGQPLAREWQLANGPIPNRHRLLPLTPFVLGGEFGVSNLVATDAAQAMRIRGPLAQQLIGATDGSQVTIRLDD